MVESKEEVLVKEERWPEAISAAVTPPIFLRRLAIAPIFSCFSAAFSRERFGGGGGGLYIDVFRSS
jgi:hypothetical protein